MMIAGNKALAVSWAIFGVTTPFLLLRIYLRCRTRNIRWFSEIAVVLAYLFYLGSNICDTEVWKRGLFQPGASYDNHWQETWLKLIHNNQVLTEIMKVCEDFHLSLIVLKLISNFKVKFAGVFIFYSQVWAVKFAILTFFYRVLPGGLMRLRHMLHCVGAFIAFTYMAVVMEMFFYCSPFSDNW